MKAYLVELEKKTIRDSDGKTLFFGPEDFIEKIVRRNCCFVCGASPSEKRFNDEHIIPDWVLREFDLHKRNITLTNFTHFRYGSFTVPCCEECNSTLGREVETPVSNLLKQPYSDVAKGISTNPDLSRLLFRWMCLIYFKTHLKDTMLLMERDRRNNAGFIGDYYDWTEFHHIHAMARAHYTDAIIDPKVYGTLLILPAVLIPGGDAFDYMDSLGAQTVMLQLGHIGIFAVLNDSNIGLASYGHRLEKIDSALNPFQLKELFARMVFVNSRIKDRPKYHSTVTQRGYEIQATVPEEFEILPPEGKLTPGELLYTYVKDMIADDLPNREEILTDIRDGRRAYMFDENDNFIRNSVAKIEEQSDLAGISDESV